MSSDLLARPISQMPAEASHQKTGRARASEVAWSGSWLWPQICEATPMAHGPGMGFCKPDAVASGSGQSHGPLRICVDPQCTVTRLMLSPYHFSRRFARMLDSPSMKFIFSYSFGPTHDVLSPTSGTPWPTRHSSLSHVCKGVPLAMSSQHIHEEINK